MDPAKQVRAMEKDAPVRMLGQLEGKGRETKSLLHDHFVARQAPGFLFGVRKSRLLRPL